jgi:hypothetical protein
MDNMEAAAPFLENLPVLTKYLSDGVAMQVVDGEVLFNALRTRYAHYTSFRYHMANTLQLRRGHDYLVEDIERAPGTKGRPPVNYFFTLSAVTRISSYCLGMSPINDGTATAHVDISTDELSTSQGEDFDDLLQTLAEIAEHFGIYDPLQAAAVAAEVVTGLDFFTDLGLSSHAEGYTASEIGARYGMSAIAVNRQLLELGYHIAQRNSSGISYKPVRIYSHLSAGYRDGTHVWNSKLFVHLDEIFSLDFKPTVDSIPRNSGLFEKLKTWVIRLFRNG